MVPDLCSFNFVLSGRLIQECIRHESRIVYNLILITSYTDNEHFPRDILQEMKPKFDALFNHYNGKINYIPTPENNAEGNCYSLFCDEDAQQFINKQVKVQLLISLVSILCSESCWSSCIKFV